MGAGGGGNGYLTKKWTRHLFSSGDFSELMAEEINRVYFLNPSIPIEVVMKKKSNNLTFL